MEAVVALNCLNITNNKFISLCGEGEWFVGSRGGSGDHAAMKCGSVGKIVHLKFKPFEVGESAKFSDEYSIVVANSMIQAKKSEGSKHKYNAKVASYEFAFMLIKRLFPDYNFNEFRDLAKVRPFSKIYEIIKEIPETVTKAGILAILPEHKDTIKKILSTHTSPDFYDLRGVAIYGVSECARSETCIDLLNQGRYEELGQFMKISHDGDRVGVNRITDEMLDEWAKNNVDIAMQSGVYDCSTEQIDYLCDLLNSTDGVLGSEIVGAGLGGCVIALVKKSLANSVVEVINKEYYDKFGYEHGACVCNSSQGSAVIY
jgi:N-acetylgalactosamine kinase